MRPRLITVLVLGLMTGCASLPDGRARPADTAPSGEIMEAVRLNSLLAAVLTVVTGTPTEQAEVMAAAKQGHEQSRSGGPALLRYGLLLAAPAHPARDPVQAQQLLREALARRELLSSLEQALATVELERVSSELRAGTENTRLVDELRQERDRARSGASSAALTRQLQAANEQNALLRRQLDEARAKLDALAELERRQTPQASQ
jgi:hypothetical protein